MPSKRSGVLFPAVFRRFFRPLLGAKAPSYSSVLHFFCMADGGRADTLIYKLTHVRVCVCILAKGCPPVRPVYPCPSIFRLILTSSNGCSCVMAWERQHTMPASTCRHFPFSIFHFPFTSPPSGGRGAFYFPFLIIYCSCV